jgi:2-phospho-L-lactate/phosphoenolpyruvate guanylyltransferase
MTPPCTIVIPIKGLRTGKTRLSAVLSDDARFDLNSYLAERTLQTASDLNGDTNICVVSPDPEVKTIAARYSADFLLQTTDGLNPALEQAARALPESRTVYLAADLPDLVVDDIRALADATNIGISPDQAGRGTNALTLPTPRTIGFRFGANSFETHCALARQTGLQVTTIDRPGLSYDLDTETDLEAVKGWPRAADPRNVPR